jgi:hypothetical protein
MLLLKYAACVFKTHKILRMFYKKFVKKFVCPHFIVTLRTSLYLNSRDLNCFKNLKYILRDHFMHNTYFAISDFYIACVKNAHKAWIIFCAK